MVSQRPGYSRGRGWNRAEELGSVLQFIPDLSKHSWPRSKGVGLWVCGFVGFCFVFLEDFFFLAVPRAFGAPYHKALKRAQGGRGWSRTGECSKGELEGQWDS